MELGAKAFHRPDRIREQESKDWTAKEIKGRGRMVSLVLVLKHKHAIKKWGKSPEEKARRRQNKTFQHDGTRD